MLVTFASLAAATLYTLMRVDTGRAIQGSFATMCSRVGMHANDWPCRVSDSRTLALYLLGSLTVGMALAVPCVVLAATGRRVTAMLPALIPIVATGLWAMTSAFTYVEPHAFGRPYLGMWPTWSYSAPETFWFMHGVLASVVDVMMIATPAIAIAVFVRPRRDRRTASPRWRWTAAALVICAAASAAAFFALSAAGHRLAPTESGFIESEPGAWIAPIVSMAAFGWLLSRDRRWWPWILVPQAILLTTAVAVAMMTSVSRIDSYGAFGEAIPYLAVGLVFSFAAPLAARLSRFRDPAPVEATDPARIKGVVPRGEPRRAPMRWAVALNAGAVALVLFASIAYRYDPAPVQFQQALPTYSGFRFEVLDLRAKMNLQAGLAAVAAYGPTHDGFAGFDAAAGAAAAPGIRWRDGTPVSTTALSPPALLVGVVSATRAQVQLVALSQSGRAFCVRAGPGSGDVASTTYGIGGTYDWENTVAPAVAFVQAIERCQDAPWTASQVRPIAVGSLCNGVDDQSIIICRATQRMARQVLASTIVT